MSPTTFLGGGALSLAGALLIQGKDHRIDMTKEKKREYNREFSRRKREQGWRFFGFVLPPVVAEDVQDFKRQRMARYRAELMEA